MVFRMSMALKRYENGIQGLEAASACWLAAANLVCGISNACRLHHLDNPQQLLRIEVYKNIQMHFLSLLSAVNILTFKVGNFPVCCQGDKGGGQGRGTMEVCCQGDKGGGRWH